MARQPGSDTFPLSMEQEWSYSARLVQPDRGRSISLVHDIRGPLDVGVFLASVRMLFERHSGLRSRLAFTDDGEPRLSVAALDERPLVNCQAVTGTSREQFDSYVRRMAAFDRRARRNPAEDPMCGLRLLRHTQDEHVFLAAFDSLAFDRRASLIFERDLWLAYGRLRDGAPCDVGSDLADAIERQRRRHECGADSADATYWPDRYALAPPVWQPSGRRRPMASSFTYEVIHDTGQELAGWLKEACRVAGCAPSTMYMAAFASLAFALTQQDRLAVWATVDTREDDDKDVIGMFTGVRPLVLDRPGEGRWSLLDQVMTEASGMLDHRHARGLTEMRLAARQRSLWRLDPRPALLVDYLASDGPNIAGGAPGELSVTTAANTGQSAVAASLALSIAETADDLRMAFCYDAALVGNDVVASLPALLNAELSEFAGTADEAAQKITAPASAAADAGLSPLRDSSGSVCLHVDVAEVQAALTAHPAIAHVNVSIGSSRDSGSEVVASVTCVAPVTDDELVKFCQSWPGATQYMVPPRAIRRSGPDGAGGRHSDRPARASGVFTIAPALTVNRIGLGAMRITGAGVWGEPRDRGAMVRLLRRAVELGVNFIDTADSYGPFVSEELIAAALHPYDGVTITTKGGLVRTGPGKWHPVGRPEYLRQCVEMSLRRLRLETISLYQLHRIDPQVPLADQLGVLDDMRQEGKIAHIGLCEVTVTQIAQACLIAPITSVQNRYNLMDRTCESVVDYCERQDLAFIPWAPLASGRLPGNGPGWPAVAMDVGATAAQIAIAWLLRRSPVVVPIPGTSSIEHLEENLAAAAFDLDSQQFASLSETA